MTWYPCAAGDGAVRIEGAGVWREITGWTQTRVGGGVHGVAFQVPTGSYLHRTCMDMLRSRRGSAPRVGIFGCEECGRPVDISLPGTWREVRAWVEQRAMGGAHAVALEVPLGAYRHSLCMDLVRVAHAEQLELFPGDDA